MSSISKIYVYDQLKKLVCFVGTDNTPMAVFVGSMNSVFNRSSRVFDIHVVNIDTNTVVTSLKGHTGIIHALHVFKDISTDKLYLASGSNDDTIRIWNLHTYEMINVFRGHNNAVTSICSFVENIYRGTCNTVLSSVCKDGTVRMWDIISCECIAVMKGHTMGVNSICTYVAPDETCMLVTGSIDNTIRIWNATIRKCVRVLEGHTNSVLEVCTVWRGRKNIIASGSSDRTIRLWDSETGDCIHVLKGHDSAVLTLSPFSGYRNNSIIASGSSDKSFMVWDIERMECLHVCHGHRDSVCSVSFVKGLRDNSVKLLSGSDDFTIKSWNMTPFVKQVSAHE